MSEPTHMNLDFYLSDRRMVIDGTRELNLPADRPPFLLEVVCGEDGTLDLQLPQWFDPAQTSTRVLRIETSMRDQVLDTQDNTRVLVTVLNTSTHYAVNDLNVTVELEVPEDNTLPDGNARLLLEPLDQRIACLEPGACQELVFLAVSRGMAPGSYPLHISARGCLLYWEKRPLCAETSVLLPVGLVPRDHRCLRFRPPPPQRSSPMPTSSKPPMPGRPKQRRPELHPVCFDQSLPGGGHVRISYKLMRRRDSDHCVYGVTEGNEIESYFSSQDEAVLELNIENCSSYDLKHVIATHIGLYEHTDAGRGVRADQFELPDGNLIMEIVPEEVYFGDLCKGEQKKKHLAIVTRGIAPDTYVVHLDLLYDIEYCVVSVDLPLAVCPD